MDPAQLKAELSRLRKGRGVSRPDVLGVLGPHLRTILDVDGTTREDGARSRLVSLLSSEAGSLPDDLNTLVRAAFGISDQAPLLHDRLVAVGLILHRDERTLRRRLADAESLMADRMVSRFGMRQGLTAPGWHWAAYRVEVDASGDRPSYLNTRTLISTLNDLSQFEEVVSIPAIGEEGSWQVDGVTGCSYLGREQLSGSSWRLLFALPRPLRAGDRHETVVRVTWPSRDSVQPVAGFVPMRPVERFDVSVDFGHPRSCGAAWILNGVLPTSYTDPPSQETLAMERTVRASFVDPLPGHAYGIAWTWA